MGSFRSTIAASIISAGLLLSPIGLNPQPCSAQQSGHTSTTLRPGSADDLRGVTSVFIFTAKDAALEDALRDGIKSTGLTIARAYDEADVILMLVPEGRGVDPDWGAPALLDRQSGDASFTAAILRRQDERNFGVVFQQRFDPNEVDTARSVLVDRFVRLYNLAKGA